MDINSLPTHSKIFKVLLPDQVWYTVQDRSFTARGKTCHFLGMGPDRIVVNEIHAPLSSILALKLYPEHQ